MTELQSDDVLELWNNTTAPTGVYIHSPFCKEQCEYCTYKGTLFNRKEFAQYYDEYLPSLIDTYRDVLSSDIISDYFFGGGTPSLMTPQMMRDLFDKIPNFKEHPKKLMEFHMVDWTEEKLDILKEYNFNTVIACVQTFDNKLLRQQKRRVPRDNESIGNFIKYADSIGLNVMSDIIYFNTDNIQKDDARLVNDLNKLAEYKTTEITIQSIFDTGWRDVSNVNNIIGAFLEEHSDYYADNGLEGEMNGEVYKNKGARLYRKGTEPLDVYPQIDSVEGVATSDMHLQTTNRNTLGIGSYKNHKHTFSKIGDGIEIFEDSDNITPKWTLAYNKSEYSVRDLVDAFYEKLEDNIGLPPDGLYFTFSTVVKTENGDERSKKTYRELVTSFSYPATSDIIEAYIYKLETLMPEWDFYLNK